MSGLQSERQGAELLPHHAPTPWFGTLARVLSCESAAAFAGILAGATVALALRLNQVRADVLVSFRAVGLPSVLGRDRSPQPQRLGDLLPPDAGEDWVERHHHARRRAVRQVPDPKRLPPGTFRRSVVQCAAESGLETQERFLVHLRGGDSNLVTINNETALALKEAGSPEEFGGGCHRTTYTHRRRLC